MRVAFSNGFWGRSPGRYCHPTLSVAGIGSHSLGIYAVTLLSLLSSFCQIDCVALGLFWGRAARRSGTPSHGAGAPAPRAVGAAAGRRRPSTVRAAPRCAGPTAVAFGHIVALHHRSSTLIPDSRRDSVPRSLKRQCDRALAGPPAAAAPARATRGAGCCAPPPPAPGRLDSVAAQLGTVTLRTILYLDSSHHHNSGPCSRTVDGAAIRRHACE